MSAVPTCLEHAYRFLAKDRAWVAVLPCDGCEVDENPHTHTIASTATCNEIALHPVGRNFVSPYCPMRERAAFLLGGIRMLEAAQLSEV